MCTTIYIREQYRYVMELPNSEKSAFFQVFGCKTVNKGKLTEHSKSYVEQPL